MLLKEKNTTEKTFAKTHRGWGGGGGGGGRRNFHPTHTLQIGIKKNYY